MAYSSWNDALGRHFFHRGHAGCAVSLYIDRRRIDQIGAAEGLGTWEDFLAVVNQGPSADPDAVERRLGKVHPLQYIDQLRAQWLDSECGTESRPQAGEFPPLFIGLSLLVLAWTEYPDHEAQSYYERLTGFFGQHFPDRPLPSRHFLAQAAQRLVAALPALQQWLQETYDDRIGHLHLGNFSHYRWVGAIRFHALIDPWQRALLPALWTEMCIPAGHPISPAQLLDLARQCTLLDDHFPTLYRAISGKEAGQRAVVADLLYHEYVQWDGFPMAYPRARQAQRLRPRLRIRLQARGFAQVCVEAPGPLPLGILRDAQGGSYRVHYPPQASIGILVHADSGLSLVPDFTWLFGALRLEDEAGTVLVRPSRSHFWAWPAEQLGHLGGGFLEGAELGLATAFMLATTGDDTQQAMAWTMRAGAVRALRWLHQGEDYHLFQAAYPSDSPFVERNDQRSKPLLRWIGGARINAGLYGTELPPALRATFFQDQAAQAEVVALLPSQPELRVTDAHQAGEVWEGRLEAPPWGPLGDYTLHLHTEEGQILTRELSFVPVRPLRHVEELPTKACQRDGSWHSFDSEDPSRRFLHNGFWGGKPPAWDIPIRLNGATSSGQVPLLAEQNLAHLLAAAANERQQVSATRFIELAKELCRRWCLPVPSGRLLAELRRNMASLGFFHWDYEAAKLWLSPLRICLLPEDGTSYRALLLGILPVSVYEFLTEWSRQHASRIQFEWRWQADPLVPPILSLCCGEFKHLQAFATALQTRFPRAMVEPSPRALAGELLEWLPALAPIRGQQVPPHQRWTSRIDVGKFWSSYHCTWVDTPPEETYPMLTRVPDRFSRTYHWQWWESDRLGWDVMHTDAIPMLQRCHNRPVLAYNAENPEQVLLIGAHRQADLLERALVLASGHLPCRVYAGEVVDWRDTFAPEAPLRMFQGITAPLRASLRRIFSHALANPADIPHIHLFNQPFEA